MTPTPDAELLRLCDAWDRSTERLGVTVRFVMPDSTFLSFIRAARESVALRLQNDTNVKARALLANDIVGISQGKPPVTANGHAVWLVIASLRADVARLRDALQHIATFSTDTAAERTAAAALATTDPAPVKEKP
jgi:hypothetical protein